MTNAAQVIDAELSQDELLATKLFRPAPRQDLVHRSRLTEDLGAGLSAPLTVVVAPAGWGKTTLLADWLSAQGRRGPASGPALPSVAWVTLDEGDNDLIRFLRYLISALQTIEADFGRPALSRLQSAQPPATEAVLTLLVNELAALSQDVVLVLDDYHAIETPAIHQALAFLLEHLPPKLHLVIATRLDPPLPLARLRARRLLTEVRAAELAFTNEEAVEFLNETMGLQLSAEDVAALETRTEGWIAGLHLAALTLRDQDAQHRHDFITALGGTHRYILDYLAGEVFDRQPPDVQRFLLSTSILGGLNGSLCDAVLGVPAANGSYIGGQSMLEWLDDANLFVVRLDDTRTWYRYHHLFAGFLRERLRRDRPDLIPELHRRAARWLEQNGYLTPAAEHALSAEEPDEAARLIELVIAPMIWQRGELMTLQRWLTRLPRAATRKRPRLSLDLAWALLWSAETDAIELRLQDAEEALAGWPEAKGKGMYGEVAAIRAELARQEGDADSALTMARRALADLPPEARLVRAVTSVLLGQALLMSGDAVAAGQAFADAADFGEAPETRTLALLARGRLVQAQMLQARLHLAAATYRQVVASAEAEGMTETPAIGAAQVYMAEILREWNDRDTAEALVRAGIAGCTEWPGLAARAVDGYITLARLLHARGDIDGAFAALDAAEAHGRDAHVPQHAERIAVARVRLWLVAGDEVAATRWARSRQSTWQTDEKLGYLGLLERIMLARLHLAHGRPHDTLALLDRLVETIEEGGLAGCMIEILVLRALSLQAQGQTPQAMTALTRALSVAEPEGYVRLFVEEGTRMVALLRQARSRGVAPAYVDGLLAACDAAGTTVTDDHGLVEPLSARELELLRLLASGLSTSEIADQLFITTGTARNHLKNIYGKLDVHSRVQAIERARSLNLL